jgi:hypothetical protein
MPTPSVSSSVSPLLALDPQPSLLLDVQARPLELNAALLALLG